MTEANIITGNPIVDAISKINISGNIIPEIWYHTIVNNKQKPNLLSITILSDIVYWYRPTEERSEDGTTISYKKKFAADDFLQRNYEQISEKFGVSKTQARDAVVFLEELGVIKRHVRTISTSSGPLPNVMFLELIPDRLMELTYPEKNLDIPMEISRDTPRNSDTPLSKNRGTYTKTTTENTPKTSTTTDFGNKQPIVADEMREVFRDLNLSDKDIASIVSASGNDITKCRNARVILDKQSTRIGNLTGWLIKAVRENYQPQSKPPVRSNSFMNFEQRERTDDYYAQLERKILLGNDLQNSDSLELSADS